MDRLLFAEDELAGSEQRQAAKPPAQAKWKVLIVDDEQDVHDVTLLALKRLEFDSSGLEFLSAYSAAEGWELLLRHPDVAVVLLDVVMEADNAGLSLVRKIRDELNNEEVRIILRTGHPGQAPEESVTLEYDINDYREKTELTARSLRTVLITALRSFKAIATIKNLKDEIDETQRELIYTLGEIAENRSVETGYHVRRVGEISAILGEKCGLPAEEVETLRLAASMHDLGKLAIEDSILNKPGKLTEVEFSVMKNHSLFGHEILRRSERPLLKMSATVAKEHHENYDGTGYPEGLKGEAISLYSRIVALADVFDALGTRRIYKEAWAREQILECIMEDKGKKFDPALVDLFFANLDEICRIQDRFSDSDEVELA